MESGGAEAGLDSPGSATLCSVKGGGAELGLGQLNPKLGVVWRVRGGRIGLGTIGAVLVWGVRKSRDPTGLGDPGYQDWVWGGRRGQFHSGILLELSVRMPGRFGTEAPPGTSWVAALSRGRGRDTLYGTTDPAMA